MTRQLRVCTECDGDRVVPIGTRYDELRGAIVWDTEPCPVCGGDGFLALPPRQIDGLGVLLAVAIIVLAALLIASAASRSGPDPTTSQPGASGTTGAVRVPAMAPVGTSGPVQSAAPQIAALLISGTATWYCSFASACTKGYGPDDLVAAIDTDLGFGKGDLLRVRAFGKYVDVVVVDVCGCPGERLIDLTRGAFAHLADPDLGVIHVTLELVGQIDTAVTAPPTDAER